MNVKLISLYHNGIIGGSIQHPSMTSPLAQVIERWALNPKILSSNPGLVLLFFFISDKKRKQNIAFTDYFLYFIRMQ